MLSAIPNALAWIWAASTLVVVVLLACDCIRNRRAPRADDLLFVALGLITLLYEAYLRVWDRDDEDHGQ